MLTTSLLLLLSPLLPTLVSAQQNVLVNGNSQLPQCAQQCALLQQANQACTTSPTLQAAWSCFCQSAYLTNLRSTAVGICDTACTDAMQNAQVSTWYGSNCGSDNGVSEHAQDSGSAATTTTGNAPAAAGTGSSGSGSNAGQSSGNSGSEDTSSSSSSSGEDWWSGHYQWIIMIIILAIGLSLLAWLFVFLKRRHDRKQDKITGGFNEGITERSAAPPLAGIEEKNVSGTFTTASGGGGAVGSGRNSPARTREAFMPYGYGYANSESRVGVDRPATTSPLARDPVMVNSEDQRQGGLGPWPVVEASSSSSSRGRSRGG